MKNLLHRFISLSLIATLLASTLTPSLSQNAQAAEPGASFFTPNRPSIVFENDEEGLSYPSFNNFLFPADYRDANGNDVLQEQRAGDERKFTLGRLCPDGDCAAIAPAYLNTVSDAAEAGDTVRFEVYFHNNGEDPHDGDRLTSPDARNVEIGIDLSALVVDQNNIVRPRGFIKADNNEYRVNPENVATTIRDQNGNPIRRATDDISLKLAAPNLQLKPIVGSASVFMNTGEGANRAELTDIRGQNNDLTITTENGTEVEVNARVSASGDKLWITFDRLPGCFDYSGMAYFDVQIVAPPVEPEPNICTALEATVFGGPREMPNGKIAFPLTITEARFREVTPANSRVLWQSPEDPNGEFYTSSVVNGTRVFTMISNNGTTVTPFTNGQVLFYAGNGPVTYRVANVADNLANLNECSGELAIPEIPDEPLFCTGLELGDYQRGATTPNGQTEHRFTISAPTFSTDEIPAGTKIRISTNNNDGTFKVFSASVWPPRFIDLPEISRNTVEITANNQSKAFRYYNDGETIDSITAWVHPNEGSLFCIKQIRTEIAPPQAPVCREIVVNYQDPIYEGTETLFSAQSFDENGNPFNEGQIRYSVDEGHGTFSNRENPQAPNNPAQREENDFQPDIQDMIDPAPVPARPAERADRPILDLRQNIQNPFGEVVIPDVVANFGLNQPVVPNQGIQIDGLIQNRVRLDQDDLPQRNFFNSVLNADAAAPINSNVQNLQINQRVLADDQVNQGLSVLADPNEGVFLNATRAGENVVHVDQLDEDGNVIEQCSADFSIIGVRCQNLAYEIDGVQNAPTIDRGEIHTIRAAAHFSGVPDPVGNNITYTIDPRYGAFIENEQALPALATIQPLTKANVEAALRSANLVPEAILKSEATRTSGPIDFRVLIYADAPQDGGAVINITSTKDGENCNAQIQVLPDIPELPACIDTEYDLTNLKFLSPIVGLGRTPTNKIERASMYEILTKSNFVNEQALAEGQNKLRISIPAEYGAIINPANSTPANEFALRTLAGFQQGSATFTADTFKAFAAQLTNGADLIQQSVLIDPSQPVIIVTYSNAPNAANVVKIEQVGFEQICKAEIPIAENRDLVCTELKFDGSFDPKNRLTEMKIRVDQFPKTGIKVTSNGECKLSKLSTSNGTDEINFVEGEDLKFYIICDSYNSETDTVEITADGGPNCKQQIKVLPTPPPAQPDICVDLDITTPDEPWNIEEDDDRQNFEIAVQTNPANLRDNFYYHFEVTDGAGTWADNDRKKVSTRGDLTQTLEDFDEDTRITVFASSDANGQNTFAACRDSIRPRLEDRPNPPSDEPEIEKVVYPKNEIDDADDLINIAGRDRMPYVTYMAAFTPGNKTKSVEIEENSLKNGSIRGNLNGELEFKAMEIIAIEDFRDEEGEIIFRSNGYQKDNSRNSAGDNNYRYNDDDFDCEDRGNRFCIEDFEDLEENFKNGEAIRFDNVDKLGADGRIIIKYQMTNKSEIDEAQCQKLRSSSGCGEQFDNTIEYTSYERTEWNDREDSGKDSAEVIVICPYILARQGGDSLMYKGFDLGVDISTCSPVKGSDGIGIEIIPEEEERIPSTGTGDEAAALLELPSHDICNFSNNENNIASYQNALENFSSTVCELEAKVAEELYEENINKAIAANIGRLARFGDNLTLKNLNSVAQLNNLENSQSGVFIKTNGDLTIDGGANGYKIEKTTEVRAAQTYIIRGHDLIINSDVIYGPTNFTDPRNIPSVAFIVIDGNIIIDENVERLDGIYMAVNLSDKEGLGEISGSAKSEKRLTIHGSLIGNVYKLFRDRIAIGDPRKDEGAVTIKYDERILLNTPPGIGELVDIKQVIVP